MSEKLSYLDRVATFYAHAQTATGEEYPGWHIYSMTEGAPEQVLQYFPEFLLPAVVFCTEKMDFCNNPPIEFGFSVMICVDATENDAEEKLCKYRKRIGEFLLAQAVMNPGLQPESAQAITFDPMIRAEVMHYTLRGY